MTSQLTGVAVALLAFCGTALTAIFAFIKDQGAKTSALRTELINENTKLRTELFALQAELLDMKIRVAELIAFMRTKDLEPPGRLLVTGSKTAKLMRRLYRPRVNRPRHRH